MAQFYLLPTTDIHLIMNPSIQNGKQFIVNFKLRDDRNELSSSIVSCTDFNNSIISVSKNITNQQNQINKLSIIINALTIGTTIIRIRYKDLTECFVRVWVHDDIKKIWVNNKKITINKGLRYHGYVVSVFAEFTDGETADITYHPYINYEELEGKSLLSINNHIITGPNSNLNISESTKLRVKVGSIHFDQLDVIVGKPFESERKILKKIYKGISEFEHKNLLILGDGFKNEEDFNAYRDSLISSLTGPDKTMFSPWYLILDNLTIWSAFEATKDENEGVTINNPVNIYNSYMPDFDGLSNQKINTLNIEELIYIVGLPDCSSPQNYDDAIDVWHQQYNEISYSTLTKVIFEEWLELNTLQGYITNKDTVLGVSIGSRLGDKVESHYVSNTEVNVNNWYKPSTQQKNIQFDRRRYPDKDHTPGMAIHAKIFKDTISPGVYVYVYDYELIKNKPCPLDYYLGSLKFPNGGTEYDMGKTWQSLGKDSKLIAIISNHSKWAGKTLQDTSWSEKFETKIVLGTISHEWRYNIKPDNLIPQKLSDQVHAINNLKNYNPLVTTGLFAHELMHAFGLADEYEENSIPTGSEAIEKLDSQANTMSLKAVKQELSLDPQKIIDATKIKWNLRRVALSSMIVSDTIKNGSNLTVKLEKYQSAKWKKIFDIKNSNNIPILPLYIRSSVYDKDEKMWFYEIEIERIISVDLASETIILLVKSSQLSKLDISKLKKGSHIYLPKRLKDELDPTKEELFIINPRVFEYIKKEKTALSSKSNCSNIGDLPQFPIADKTINEKTPSTIYPEFSSPKNRFLVSGIYEGGGTWSCEAYRGNGFSILRKPYLSETVTKKIASENSNEDIQVDIPLSEMLTTKSDIAIYGRFDFIAKYYLVAVVYPTKLEDLDRQEYKFTDSSIL